MPSVAWAFAWQIWRSHRWAVIPPLAYLPALVLLVHLLPADTLDARGFGQLTLPLSYIFPLLLALFSFGDQGDILVRESLYPRRMFTLPLRTTALVGWPLALGAVALAGWWLVVAGLVLRPTQPMSVPLLWPAAFLVALLAWTQALSWLPFPLTVLRLLIMLPVLGGLIAAAILACVYAVPAPVLLAASLGLIPPGYALAVIGVGLARRGDGAIRYWPLLPRSATGSDAAGQPFASPRAALTWLEWRSNLYLLPFMAMLVLLLLPLVYFLTTDEMLRLLVPGLVTYPMLMGFVTGTSLGNCHPWARHQPAMTAFLAARPVTNGTLLAIKLKGVIAATLATWGMLFLGLALTLPFCRAGTLLLDGLRRLYETQGDGRATCLLSLVGLGVPALSLKWALDQLWIGLVGRRWIGEGALVAFGCLFAAAGIVVAFAFAHPTIREWVLLFMPWVIAAALLLKVIAGAYIGRQLLRRDLVSRPVVLGCACAWLAAAAGIVALAYWLVPPHVCSPLAIGSAAIVVALPLVRLGAAPLALAWNRHR